jgi:SOS response regulatory protein OraA/RecX
MELKKASEFGKLYQRTLEWVLMRPRSLRETRDYLFRKLRSVSRGPSATNEERGSEVHPVTTGGHERVREEYSEFSEEIVSRLVDRGYLDDRRFAEFWVENRFVKKGVSKKRLKMELMKKGVAMEIIEEVLDGRDDEDELRKMIARKRTKYDDPQKLVAYLCRQGFSYDLVKELVEKEVD